MKAVRMTGAGRPLVLEEIATPEPAPGEVRVRVHAAGICHSDVHYRAGISPMGPLPLTLGHEIAGTLDALGPGVMGRAIGERVCLHYLRTCGTCESCRRDQEFACETGAMLGHHIDGGFAEFVVAPARNAVPLPEAVPFEHGAILMCSSATVWHALRRGRLAAGETVAVFGIGGLGVSAVQLARELGASAVLAVDLDPAKLAIAARLGAIPVNAADGDPVDEIRRRTRGRGVDVALELVGRAATMKQSVRSLASRGRAVVVGIGDRLLEVDPYAELIGGEIELMGSNDHALDELAPLVEMARDGRLDLSMAITRRVPLEAAPINEVLDAIEAGRGGVRSVVIPAR
jgi:propanol-preferring alcohol dehydrogenase